MDPKTGRPNCFCLKYLGTPNVEKSLAQHAKKVCCVAEFVLSRRLLEELALFQKNASPSDLELLERTLASIVEHPNVPDRMLSYYDPASPSYLYRAGQLLIHYRLPHYERVEFLNLFWPRV